MFYLIGNIVIKLFYFFFILTFVCHFTSISHRTHPPTPSPLLCYGKVAGDGEGIYENKSLLNFHVLYYPPLLNLYKKKEGKEVIKNRRFLNNSRKRIAKEVATTDRKPC